MVKIDQAAPACDHHLSYRPRFLRFPRFLPYDAYDKVIKYKMENIKTPFATLLYFNLSWAFGWFIADTNVCLE